MVRYVRGLCVLVLSGILGLAVPQHLLAQLSQASNAQAQDKKDTHGNPSTKVWVNTKSHVYHCPGTRYYGRTINGEYMAQADAQKKGNRPAYGKYCS
jgi:hypothetical protein